METVYDFLNNYLNSANTYPETEKFVSDKGGIYKQQKGGYIDYFKREGNNNPNQKEHLLESYKKYLDKKPINKHRNSSNIYNSLKCPELLLWLAEASGVDRKLVIKASQLAKKKMDEDITDKRKRNAAGKIIRDVITFEVLMENIHNRLDIVV